MDTQRVTLLHLHDWKKPERKRKNLVRLGVDHENTMHGAEQEWADGQKRTARYRNNNHFGKTIEMRV